MLAAKISERIYFGMDAIRRLRRERHMTQAELAAAAGTSQPTVAAYEAGRKSPTWRTLQRIAESAGVEAWVEFYPPMTREDRRSLALHHAIAEELQADPEGVLARARRTLARMARVSGESPVLREWRVLLDRPLEALVPVLTEHSPWSRELRHVSPFAGALSGPRRAEVLREFQDAESSR
jgi:transcriptional regulator with XRE-family HTH domain